MEPARSSFSFEGSLKFAAPLLADAFDVQVWVQFFQIPVIFLCPE
jgi:hypothetical protein